MPSYHTADGLPRASKPAPVTGRRIETTFGFADFHEASREVLQFLHRQVGLGLWLATRYEGEDQIVLDAENHAYDIDLGPGSVFAWSDTYCSRMVNDEGPRVAPLAREIACYVAAAANRELEIHAYLGVPMTRRDGRLLGTLCAVDPEPQASQLHEHLPLVELQARLLGTILERELEHQAVVRRLERLHLESQTDAMTGLYNRRGWERLVEAEEERCRRYGSPGGVLVMDLDGLKEINDAQGHAAGDRLIERAAEALRGAVRASDVVARLGGDEFAVLAVEARPRQVRRLARRLGEHLVEAGAQASIGWASRDPRATFQTAIEEADAAMYETKRGRRGERGRREPAGA